MTPTVSVIITDLIAVFCSCTNQTIPLIRDCINPCKSKFPLKKKKHNTQATTECIRQRKIVRTIRSGVREKQMDCKPSVTVAILEARHLNSIKTHPFDVPGHTLKS